MRAPHAFFMAAIGLSIVCFAAPGGASAQETTPKSAPAAAKKRKPEKKPVQARPKKDEIAQKVCTDSEEDRNDPLCSSETELKDLESIVVGKPLPDSQPGAESATTAEPAAPPQAETKAPLQSATVRHVAPGEEIGAHEETTIADMGKTSSPDPKPSSAAPKAPSECKNATGDCELDMEDLPVSGEAPFQSDLRAGKLKSREKECFDEEFRELSTSDSPRDVVKAFKRSLKCMNKCFSRRDLDFLAKCEKVAETARLTVAYPPAEPGFELQEDPVPEYKGINKAPASHSLDHYMRASFKGSNVFSPGSIDYRSACTKAMKEAAIARGDFHDFWPVPIKGENGDLKTDRKGDPKEACPNPDRALTLVWGQIHHAQVTLSRNIRGESYRRQAGGVEIVAGAQTDIKFGKTPTANRGGVVIGAAGAAGIDAQRDNPQPYAEIREAKLAFHGKQGRVQPYAYAQYRQDRPSGIRESQKAGAGLSVVAAGNVAAQGPQSGPRVNALPAPGSALITNLGVSAEKRKYDRFTALPDVKKPTATLDASFVAQYCAVLDSAEKITLCPSIEAMADLGTGYRMGAQGGLALGFRRNAEYPLKEPRYVYVKLGGGGTFVRPDHSEYGFNVFDGGVWVGGAR